MSEAEIGKVIVTSQCGSYEYILNRHPRMLLAGIHAESTLFIWSNRFPIEAFGNDEGEYFAE